ncbi:MAG: dihydrolipoyl dehydrogenase [Methanotrichaceae archaeon]|nr:dihydrolipoyl dehydrogenase [Methanotrichaceae archaeon]
MDKMEKFDLIIVGSGAGMNVASRAVQEVSRVALVERGPLGGTCLNNGCIPSKMLIYPADVVRMLQDAKAVGVEGRIENIDFKKIMGRMLSFINEIRTEMETSIEIDSRIKWYKSVGEFIGDKILKAGDNTLTAPRFVIASGARALIPPVPGLREAGYLDNISLLDLEKPPRRLIIIGAGYIGCEYGHFFSSMGTEVTILGRSTEVLSKEDLDIRKIIAKSLSRHMRVLTRHEVVRMEKKGDLKVVSARNLADDKLYQFEAEEILVATGRRSNSDLLKPEKSGVETDKSGWIIVNEYLETSKPGIWAIGDAIGKHMFRHTANYEAEVAYHNIFRAEKKEDKKKIDFHAVPHAVFCYPPAAQVGLNEDEAKISGLNFLVGRANYSNVAKGVAMGDESGLAKVLVEEDTGRILGCSIVGPFAPELVQQVVYLMNTDNENLGPIMRSQVIHPTMSEVIISAFNNLEHPYHLL